MSVTRLKGAVVHSNIGVLMPSAHNRYAIDRYSWCCKCFIATDERYMLHEAGHRV